MGVRQRGESDHESEDLDEAASSKGDQSDEELTEENLPEKAKPTRFSLNKKARLHKEVGEGGGEEEREEEGGGKQRSGIEGRGFDIDGDSQEEEEDEVEDDVVEEEDVEEEDSNMLGK